MYPPVKKKWCCLKPDGLVTLIKKHYCDKIKYVTFKTTDVSEVSHKTYSFEAKLKDCYIPIKFVVIFGKWNKDDDNKHHILITNNLRASAKMVITNYLLRWGTEHCFRELKNTFSFDHCQVRHINKIDRYWNSALPLELLLIGSSKTCPRVNGDAYLAKILETKPTTFNEIKRVVNSILEFTDTSALSKNDKLADGYFKIKSKRLKKNVPLNF